MATIPAVRRLLPSALLLTLLLPGVAHAQEVSRGAQPTPDNVGELGGALQEAFEPSAR